MTGQGVTRRRVAPCPCVRAVLERTGTTVRLAP